MLPSFLDSVVQLVVRTSTDLPPDVRAAMKTSLDAEAAGSRASQALTIIAQNIDLAVEDEGAICQDTGMPTFEVKVPVGANQIWMRGRICEAVAEATRRGKLRPNSVDSITGTNSGDNLGPGTPIIHFDQWDRDEIEIKLILKGGGCENTNAQYALPVDLPHLGRADRTLEGVRKCILHAAWSAQGKGCSPGAVGVCIGGDRTSGYAHAKEQLFRTLDDVNPDSRLAELEASVMGAANNLGVGAMGFGGAVTLIGCKVGALNRLLGIPAPWSGARCVDRRDQELAVSRSVDPHHPDARSGRLHADGTRSGAPCSAHRRRRAGSEGGRRRAPVRAHVHGARRRAFASDEARSAGRSARLGPVPLRSCCRKGWRGLAGHGRGADDEHS
jgi:tartrate/fumarate subfamily iron-sulfur-dependent hydro-lyase alpha chain